MKDVPTTQLGSTRWLSNSDIKMLYRMYDCGKVEIKTFFMIVNLIKTFFSDISKMPTMTIPDPCHDQSSYKFCSTIAKKGYCVVNEKDCYKTCNCDLNMCVDKFDECRELAENTESCQSEKMQKDCYKSCFPEICSNSFFTTTTAAPPPSVCQDHPEERYSCFEHSRDGKCGQEGFEWMEYDCRYIRMYMHEHVFIPIAHHFISEQAVVYVPLQQVPLQQVLVQQPPQQIPLLLALMIMRTVTICYGTAILIGPKGSARNLAIIVTCALTYILKIVLSMRKMANVKRTLGEIIIW